MAGVQGGAGQQDGAPLLQSGLALEQLNGPGRPKERKDEEMKTWWLKYSVSLGVGWGARAQPRGLLFTGRAAQRGWNLADGFSSGWGRLVTRQLDRLLDLLGPLHVVCPRLLTCQALDEVFQATPEAYHL